MTTYAQLITTGRGSLVYLLEIAGIGVFTTYKYTPADSWFATADYTADRVWAWLQWDSLPKIREQVNYLEADLDVGSIRLVLADIGGGFTSLSKGHLARTWTRLSVTLSKAEVLTATVESTSGWPASGAFYVGRERIEYTAKTADTFTGLARHTLGTEEREHFVSLTVSSAHPMPEQPIIADGPHSLVGLRALLHVAVIGADGTPGATSVVYRGRIGKGVKTGKGRWEIPIEHISKGLKDHVAGRMESSPIQPGYWYSGTGPCSGSRIVVDDYTAGSCSATDVYIAQGWRGSPASLADDWGLAVGAAAPGISPYVQFEGERYVIRAGAVANKRVRIPVVFGDPLWALGFEALIVIEGDINTDLEFEAPDPPRLYVIDFSDDGERPEIEVGDATVFTVACGVMPPGQAYALVQAASGTTVTLAAGSHDPYRADRWYWFAEEEEDLVLSHVWVLGSMREVVSLRVALKRLLHLDDDTPQVEPERWAAQSLTNDDFDWDELTLALSHAPPQLRTWKDCLTEGTEVWRVMGHPLAMLGVVPRITDEGKIGFVRVETPIVTTAVSVPLDDEIWSLIGAAEVEATLNDSPLVNKVSVKYSHDYREGGGGSGGDKAWPDHPIDVCWDEGLNLLGKTRAIRYECRGWLAGTPGRRLGDFAEAISRLAVFCHFSVFGREAPTVDIPSTFTSRQLRCGDIVVLTHELVPDTTGGAIGVEERLGLIVGRIYDLTGREEDTLLVRVGPVTRGRGIAPCAWAESWDAPTKTLSCPTWADPKFAQVGDTDLDAFGSSSTVAVRLLERDDKTPSTWTATIAVGGADTATGDVVLTTDPFAGAFPAGGVWIAPADWDSKADIHTLYCYISDNDATPSLGAAGDDPHTWTI